MAKAVGFAVSRRSTTRHRLTITMTNVPEAIGIVLAPSAISIPVAIRFNAKTGGQRSLRSTRLLAVSQPNS